MPLAVGLRTDRQRHRAIGLERRPRELARHAAGSFEKAGNADAAQQTGLLRLRAALAKAVAIGERNRLVQTGAEAAAVDLHAHRGAMRKPADDVAPAQFDGIDPGSDRCEVHQALDQVIGFGLAGAAIGVDRRRVGEGAAHLEENSGNVIDAAYRAAGGIGGTDGAQGRKIGAHVGDGPHFQAEKPAILVEREFRAGKEIAALRGCDKILRSFGDPAHRAAELSRRPQHQHIFGIEIVLHPEAAADVGHHHADALGRNFEDGIGELPAKIVDTLAGQRKAKPVGLAVMEADGGARLHGGGDHAVVEEVAFDDMRRRRHRGGNRRSIALAEQEGGIARRLRPDRRGVRLQRRGGHGDAGQRFIGDIHRFAGRHRRLRRLRDDADHGIADMPHETAGQRRARRNHDRLDRLDHGDARQLPDAVGREVGFAIDRHDAGDGARGCQVQPRDPGEGDGRANHMGMQHPGHVIVGDIFAVAGEEAMVLQPVQRPSLITLLQLLTFFPLSGNLPAPAKISKTTPCTDTEACEINALRKDDLACRPARRAAIRPDEFRPPRAPCLRPEPRHRCPLFRRGCARHISGPRGLPPRSPDRG